MIFIPDVGAQKNHSFQKMRLSGLKQLESYFKMANIKKKKS